MRSLPEDRHSEVMSDGESLDASLLNMIAELQAERAEIEEAIRALELVKTGKPPQRAYRRSRSSTKLAKKVEGFDLL